MHDLLLSEDNYQLFKVFFLNKLNVRNKNKYIL